MSLSSRIALMAFSTQFLQNQGKSALPPNCLYAASVQIFVYMYFAQLYNNHIPSTYYLWPWILCTRVTFPVLFRCQSRSRTATTCAIPDPRRSWSNPLWCFRHLEFPPGPLSHQCFPENLRMSPLFTKNAYPWGFYDTRLNTILD